VVDDKGNEYEARLVIVADGSGSKIAKRLNMLVDEEENIAVATRAYFENVTGLEDYIEIHFLEEIVPGYGWIFPQGRDSANVGAGSWLSKVKEIGLDKIFNKFVTGNRFAIEKLSSAKRVGDLMGWPLYMGGYIKRMVGNGVMVVGDAACLVNPLTGEGIYYALESGRMAAEVGGEALGKGDLTEKTLKRYEEICRGKFSEDYEYSVAMRSVTSDVETLNTFLERAEADKRLADLLTGIVMGVISKKKAFEEEMMQFLMG
jgi:flavin-dependent dehydrogenase